jgi:hypothetical protein
MKKILILMICLILVTFVTGCTKEIGVPDQTEPETKTTPTPEPEVQEPETQITPTPEPEVQEPEIQTTPEVEVQTPEPKTVSYELTDEEKAKVNFKENSRLIISTPFVKMDPKEVTVIGLGLHNILDGQRQFRVRLNVREVQEYLPGGASSITVTTEANLADQWLTLNLPEATLGQSESTVIPLIIEAKEDIGSGLKTKAGHKVSYSIRVEESHEGEFWNEYTQGPSDLVVRIY